MKRKFVILMLCPLLLLSCKKKSDIEVSTKKTIDTLKINANHLHFEVPINATIYLDATMPGATSYYWEPNHETTPVIRWYGNNSSREVTIVTPGGTYHYEFWIQEHMSDTYIIYITAFTPNGDGINDLWHPSILNIQGNNFLLNVYDAKCTLLYTSKDYWHMGWDGKYQGYYCENGMYYFIMRYLDSNNEEHTDSGQFELIR